MTRSGRGTSANLRVSALQREEPGQVAKIIYPGGSKLVNVVLRG
jgi:hypothetical protein